MKQQIVRLLPVIVTGALILLWQIFVKLADIPLYILPAPVDVIRALFLERSSLFSHAVVTIAEALLGMAIAVSLALLLGVLMDAFGSFKASIYPLLVVTQTIPVIVLAPIFIIYLGFGLAPKILTVVLMCFFPVVISFTDGMAEVKPAYINLLRSFGADNRQVYLMVKFPAAFPSFITGLKVAATYSISGAVVGEWIAAQSGLGYYMIRVKNGYMLDKVFACVVIIILLSLLMNKAVLLLQYLLMPYSKKNKRGK